MARSGIASWISAIGAPVSPGTRGQSARPRRPSAGRAARLRCVVHQLHRDRPAHATTSIHPSPNGRVGDVPGHRHHGRRRLLSESYTPRRRAPSSSRAPMTGGHLARPARGQSPRRARGSLLSLLPLDSFRACALLREGRSEARALQQGRTSSALEVKRKAKASWNRERGIDHQRGGRRERCGTVCAAVLRGSAV